MNRYLKFYFILVINVVLIIHQVNVFTKDVGLKICAECFIKNKTNMQISQTDIQVLSWCFDFCEVFYSYKGNVTVITKDATDFFAYRHQSRDDCHFNKII